MSRIVSVAYAVFCKQYRSHRLTLLLIFNLFVLGFTISDIYWLSNTRLTLPIYLSRLILLTIGNAMIIGSNIVWDDFKNNTIVIYLAHGLDSTSYILGIVGYALVIHLASSITLSIVSFALNFSHFAFYWQAVSLSLLSLSLLFALCISFILLLSFFIPSNGNSFLFLLLFLGISVLKVTTRGYPLILEFAKWLSLAIPNIDMVMELKGRIVDDVSSINNILHIGLLFISFLFLSTLCFDRIKKVWK